MTAEPPLELGAVHESVTDPSPLTPLTEVGAPGVVNGVAEIDSEYSPIPHSVSAATLKVYVVAFLNEEIVLLLVVEVV